MLRPDHRELGGGWSNTAKTIATIALALAVAGDLKEQSLSKYKVF